MHEIVIHTTLITNLFPTHTNTLIIVIMLQRQRHHESKQLFRIVNIVTTQTIGRVIDTKQACIATHGKLGMEIFPSYVSRSRSPACTNSLFSSGQLLNTGSRSYVDALLGVNRFINLLSKNLNCSLRLVNFSVQNIVIALDLGFKLNLALLLEDGLLQRKFDRKYEPSIFPGLKLESRFKDIIFILFISGNVIGTGLKSQDRVPVAQQVLAEFGLRQYELGKEYRQMSSSSILRMLKEPSSASLTDSKPKRHKKPSKANQFKVITHTRKRARFHDNLRLVGLGLTNATPARNTTSATAAAAADNNGVRSLITKTQGLSLHRSKATTRTPTAWSTQKSSAAGHKHTTKLHQARSTARYQRMQLSADDFELE